MIINYLQSREVVETAIDVVTIEQLSIGGVLLLFIGLLVFQIFSLQKKFELEKKSMLEYLGKKDIIINELNEARITDHKGFTQQLITIQRSTDQLVSDIKTFYSKK